jgi:hypothetical protein
MTDQFGTVFQGVGSVGDQQMVVPEGISGPPAEQTGSDTIDARGAMDMLGTVTATASSLRTGGMPIPELPVNDHDVGIDGCGAPDLSRFRGSADTVDWPGTSQIHPFGSIPIGCSIRGRHARQQFLAGSVG